ncbi:uncharacterized protein [Argopecten irradians]|uniref:uncharacterized protein n=1 Tax=Argopecten irradians TaxID=31199 RepID=UPI003710C956
MIDIAAGVLDNSMNDTIELPNSNSPFNNQTDVVPSSIHGDTAQGENGTDVATGNQIDIETGNQAETAPVGDTVDIIPDQGREQVLSANQTKNIPNTGQIDTVQTGNQVNKVPFDAQVDTFLTERLIDSVLDGNQVDSMPPGDRTNAGVKSARKPPTHIETPGSDVNTHNSDVNGLKDRLFSGPYPTVEEINSDKEKFYDAAICKRCNPDITVRNSCFLKHPRDCRKYIHCFIQNDKWTAFIMRCSFGTFWSDEDNTCQFSHMVDCHTDLCRNPSLTSYDSGLNENCRAFWSCERGHSVPLCCEKYHSYRHGQCVEDSNCTTACPEPCQNTDTTAYPNELNCRSFYECHDKKSKSMCCADGQSYMNGTCVDDSLCTVPCPVDAFQLERVEKTTATTNQPSPNPSCSLEAVGEDKFQFIGNTNKHHVMSCPGNLLFSVKKCTCDFPTADVLDTLPRECKPEVCIDFEPHMNPVKVENDKNVDISGGRGHFNGLSYLAIPLYSFNERFSKRINIKMLFKSTPGKGQDRQVLISNCRTEISSRNSRLSPSLAIIIDKSVGQHYVIFLGTTKNNGNASIAHTFQPNQWTSLELVFNGQRLTATTNTIDYDTGASIDSQFDTKELTGELKVGLEPLRIGKCLDRDGFHGEMDDVCIGDCLNGNFAGGPSA